MAIHYAKYTGDVAFLTDHVAGNKIYCRSTNAGDAGTINLYGRATSGSTADAVQLNPDASKGQLEILTSANWDNLYLVQWDTALTGVGSVFSNNGTAATGTFRILSQPADGDTFQLGLAGNTKTFTWETGTIDTNGHVKSVANTTTCAANLASAINDSEHSGASGAEDTGWKNTDGANPYLTATASGPTVTVTDKINCARQLAWVSTASNTANVSVAAIRGGIDGTKIVDIGSGNTGASTSLTSGLDLDEAALTTTNIKSLITGASDAIPVRGKFNVDIKFSGSPNGTLPAKIELSPDGTNWRDAVSTIADIDGDHDQIISGDDLFAQFARLNITANSNTTALSARVIFYAQS